MSARVEEVMSRDVFAIAPDTDLSAVRQLFALTRAPALPVVDDRGCLLGLVVRADLPTAVHGPVHVGSRVYYRLWAGQLRLVGSIADDGGGPGGVASSVMTSPRRVVEATDDLRAAAQLMDGAGSSLLVIEDGRLVGLLTTEDCLRDLET